jgi:hypothetical protein
MGAWGTGILSDDTVRDVYSDYLDLFNRGNAPAVIRQKLLERYKESLEDSDDGPLIWVGIAKAQWDCAQLEPKCFQKFAKSFWVVLVWIVGLNRESAYCSVERSH